MKKHFLLFLMGFVTFSGFAQLDEDFEAAPDEPDASGVWTMASGNWLVKDNRLNEPFNWQVNPGVYPANGGAKAAFVNRENTGDGVLAEEWLITPQVLNIQANRQLRFFTRQTLNGDTGTLYQIRVSSDPDPLNFAAYVVLQQYTETTLSTVTANQLDYEEKVINFSFTGTRYFAFVKVFTQEGDQTSGDRWLVDDVHIVERCPEPTQFGVENVSAYNATLTWQGSAVSYNIEYGPSGFVPGTGTVISGIADGGATDSYTIPLEDPPGPLTPDTAYQFYVTAVCSESVSQQTGPFNFTTSPLGSTCDGPIVVTPLPYFDTGNTIQQGNNINFPSPGGTGCGTTGDFLAGNDVVYSYTVPATTTGLISIEMNPLGNTGTGVFVYDECSDIGSNCLAGVGNNNGSIRSIPALEVTAGNTIYIVISSTNDSFEYNLTIQDVTCAPPTGLSATGTGPNSANLSWQNPGGATAWEVFVQTAGTPVPSAAGIPAGTNTNFGVTQLTQEGTTLQLGTPYQYWVRALCPDGVSFSQWAGPYLFNTTSCTSGCNYIFELTDTFGDGWNGNTMSIIQDGLPVGEIGPTFEDGEGPIQVSIPMCDGPFEIFWNTGGDFPGEVGFTVINSFGQSIFSFGPFAGDQQGSTIYNGEVDCANPLCLPPTQVTWSSPTPNGVTIAWTPNGLPPASWDIVVLPIGSPAPDENTTPTANTTENPFELTSGLLPDTEYVIYVRAVCTTPGDNPWSNPSEPFFTLPTCPKPTALYTQNPDLTSIQFGWTPGLNETAWQYIFVAAGSPAPAVDDPNWVDTTETLVTITTGLVSGTAYDFYVRAICAADDISTLAGPYTANTTICAASEQCVYTFTMIDTFGDGWNGNTMNILQNGVVVATIGANFETGEGPIDVQIPLCHGVSFEIFWNEGGAFAGEVGLTVTSFLGQNIFTHNPGGNQQGETLFAGTAECVPPTCLAPTGVTVTSTSLTSATITWDENNTPAATSWNVLVLPSTAPPPAQDATGWVLATAPPFVYDVDLTAATSYTVYVRSVCSETDNSFWSAGFDFSTQICAPADVCDYTFTMTDSFGDGWNGNTMTIFQNGIPVATIGADFTDGEGPIQQVITLCNNIGFELFWNNGGAFAGEVGIQIHNQSGEQVFTYGPNGFDQGTTLFSGTVQCVPATCPKPTQLYVDDVTTTSALLGWTESGTATQWEVILLPAGSPIPAPDAEGIETSDNPYLAALTSGTAYVFYVRAICAPGDLSNWAGPLSFASLITNDECDTAIVVPVNGDQSCAQIASGTIIGATPSTLPQDCGGSADDDVWFQFTASTTAHNIDLFNIQGSTEDLFHILYVGDNCGNLTQVYCSDANQSIATGLTVGQTYFIRVYSWTETQGQTSTFDICIGTIPPPISSTTTSHTNLQLIEDVLLNTTCASVSNVTSSTGTDFGLDTNGIGYFERNGSSFPFEYGVVLSSGDANMAPGPNTNIQSEGDFTWPGDADLDQILIDQGIVGTLGNATSLEFDFVPLTNNISFNFIFASEEYGTFQCNYSDVFGFILTNLTTNETTNLAVLPNTDIPISVTTIRNNLYNDACESANEEYFAAYYDAPEGNPLEAPINFNGVTVPLTASAPVIPGQPYHIKLAISDFGPFGQDNALDSAVFIEGGSFGLGNLELGDNLLEENGSALCEGGSIELNSSLNPDEYTFTWFLGDQQIPDATGATLTVTQEGEYSVTAVLNNSTCSGTDSIVVEYYPPVVPGQANALTICDAATTGVFDLTTNASSIIAPIGSGFTLTYYTTLAEAQAGVDGTEISTPTAYTNTSNPQTIYVRAENASGCFGVTTFELIINDLTPQFTLPADFSICAGSSGTIAVTPINFDLGEVTFSWTFDTNPLPDTTSSITVTQAGYYEVTVNRSGCVNTAGVNVSVDAQVTPTFTLPTNVCQNATAIALPTTSVNGVTGTWSPASVDTSLAGTLNYCFTPDASQTCALPVCLDITVNPEVTPQFAPIPVLCVGTVAPGLPTTSLNGVVGVWSPAVISTAVPGTFNFDFTPAAGQDCTLPTSLTVTVLPANQLPDFVPLAPICSGASFTLPTTSTNGITGVWSPLPNNQTTTTYTFDPDPGQCAIQATMTVVVNFVLEPGFEPIGSLCMDTLAPTLENISPMGISGTWNPAVINTQTPGSTDYVFTPDAGQCATGQTLTVTIISLPEFALVGDCVGPQFVLSIAPGTSFGSSATYAWADSENVPIPGADEATLVATATGTYYLTVSQEGCSYTASIPVDSVSCTIQKGISPGDGSDNDFFDLAGLNVRRLEIFNRYGTKVYSQANYSREWYGQTDKGDELPDGTYYYVIERDTETKTGWIYINRVK